MTDSLGNKLASLKNDLDRLPEAEEPPSTTLQIIRNNQQERDWQRLLFHYLSPDESHGLNHALLEHILSGLSDRDDLGFTFSRLDLADVQLKQEVKIPNDRRPDAVVWASENWFICWELKVNASEGKDQTRDYVDAQSFQSIDLAKEDVLDSGHHYLYLAPEEASPPGAEEFVQISWSWVAEQIQTFLTESHGEYPARTSAQLETFVGTIRSEIMTTEYQENQQEKAELYFEYYDAVTEAQEAFENRWDWFSNNWGNQLAEAMDDVEPVEFSSLRDADVAVEPTQPSIEDERWVFRQGASDWAGIFKEGWWRDIDDFSHRYTHAEDKEDDVRITLYHRLEQNREQAVRDRSLELQLWHGVGGSGDSFTNSFKEKLTSKMNKTDAEIPPVVSVTGSTGKPLTATYDIPAQEQNDFFDAYVAALDDAFHDLVIENREIITLIDEAYEESLEVLD